MRELTYSFDELPAFTELGFGFGSFTGEATIRFAHSGEWSIGEIKLDGARYDKKERKWEYKMAPLCEKSHRELYLSLFDALETARKDAISDLVIEALESDGVSFTSDFDEHNTHHYAFSGAR